MSKAHSYTPDPYISEVKYLGSGGIDFIEVAVNSGMDVSDVFVTAYHPDGTVRAGNALGSLVATQHGKDIYVIETATFTDIHKQRAWHWSMGGTCSPFNPSTTVLPLSRVKASPMAKPLIRLGKLEQDIRCTP